MTKFLKLIFLGQVALSFHCCLAQEFQINYTTELQSNFTQGINWNHLLRMDFTCSLGKNTKLQAATISTAKTRKKSLADDWQTFSNIEEGNHPLAIAVLGIQQQFSHSSLFLGIRNLNEDYFTSPVTSLFTNSSCGIFPTLSANYQIANYPVASVGIHYELQFNQWSVQTSAYNGKGYYQFTGKENAFRFCPQDDGILSVTSLNYQNHDSNYHMGFALHSSMYRDYEEGTSEKEKRKIIWGYAEQCLIPCLHALLQGSFQLDASKGCKSYVGTGLVWKCGKTEGGLFTDYAHFSPSYEWASEFTWKIHWLNNGFIQPTLHYIRQAKTHYLIGLLRFSYVIPVS